MLLLYLLTACSEPRTTDIIELDEGVNDLPTQIDDEAVVDDDPPVSSVELEENDRPTIPDNVAEGIEYLYDFRFSEKYDDHITGDFSLSFSDKVSHVPETFYLFDKYHNDAQATEETLYDGDGLVPHMYKRYGYSFEQGNLIIRTDYYEPDQVEYISYLWTDVEGVETNRNVAVGSTEDELLSAYNEHIYYFDKDEALSDELLDFEYAYFWQPYTLKTNELRDITFYIKSGKVEAIEIVQPFELRYVYGYDHDAGLQRTE